MIPMELHDRYIYNSKFNRIFHVVKNKNTDDKRVSVYSEFWELIASVDSIDEFIKVVSPLIDDYENQS